MAVIRPCGRGPSFHTNVTNTPRISFFLATFDMLHIKILSHLLHPDSCQPLVYIAMLSVM